MTGPRRGPLRVCVCTSVEAAREPRAPRHAAWLAQLGEQVSVVFVDCAPIGAHPAPVRVLDDCQNIERRTHRFPTRATSPLRWVIDRFRQTVERFFSTTGTGGALSPRAFGLARVLADVDADVYIAHMIETLVPAWDAARSRNALIMFDSMEFHSDMGAGQSEAERRITRRIEAAILPKCALVFASSEQVASALADAYGIPVPLALHNVPPVESTLPPRPSSGLTLYWRNAVIGLGPRGLEDALSALSWLPADVTLHLQGRMPADGGAALKARMEQLEVTDRVVIHGPYAPEDAVRHAAPYHVGLCLERRECRNHELTISNKIFDYHMAGLAVIASDLPGLRSIVDRSGGGLLYQPGDARELAARIQMLRDDRALLDRLAASARSFALREGNREVERAKFMNGFSTAVTARLGLPVGESETATP